MIIRPSRRILCARITHGLLVKTEHRVMALRVIDKIQTDVSCSGEVFISDMADVYVRQETNTIGGRSIGEEMIG